MMEENPGLSESREEEFTNFEFLFYQGSNLTKAWTHIFFYMIQEMDKLFIYRVFPENDFPS